MSNYMIHACPERMWYVEQYLVPSMKEQGINNVTVKCDTEHVGNLESCMKIFSQLPTDGGTWHLQDDVIICRDFAERTEYLSDGVVCGFVFGKDENHKFVGTVTPFQMWWSFPCIHIPNKLAKECAEWFYRTAQSHLTYAERVLSNREDDYFFKEYMRIFYPSYPIENIKPCLVDHIDYLIGGTTGKKRKNPIVRAEWFEDTDLVAELEKNIKDKRSNHE